MSRKQRDEPFIAHIADCGNTSTGDEKDHINSILEALETWGKVKLS